MSCYVAGPNEALIVSGGLCSEDDKSFIVGGYTVICPLTTQVDRLSLEIMTITPRCEKVETLQGVALTVTGAAQVKFLVDDPEMLHRAAEQFLGKTVSEVKDVVLQTLEGHLRAILGTLTVEEVYQDREKFASQVREVAVTNVARMGIDILSFVIKDIEDDVDYLTSLGKKRTAEVKRDADIGVSEAERDAGIKESEAERASSEVRYKADTQIADHKTQYELKKFEYLEEVNSKKADAELAYQLREAQLKQNIRKEEIQIEVIERQKQIQVEEEEIKRREHELKTTITLPANAERYRTEKIADGSKQQTILEAEGESEGIKLIGTATASAILAKGLAEASAMSAKADAYAQYGPTAIMSMALEVLPKVAAELAAPLSKTDEIIILPGANSQSTTTELTKMISMLPPSVRAVSGVDLSQALHRMATGPPGPTSA